MSASHAANLPLPGLAQRQQVGSIDDATTHASTLPTPTNGKPVPTQSPGTSRHPVQPNFQTHEISTEATSVGVSRDSHGSSHQPFPNEPYSLSNSGNDNGGYLFSIVHGMHTVNAGNHGTVPTPGGRSENSIFGTAQKPIDEMAKVTQLIISPSHSDRNSVPEARAWESGSGG